MPGAGAVNTALAGGVFEEVCGVGGAEKDALPWKHRRLPTIRHAIDVLLFGDEVLDGFGLRPPCSRQFPQFQESGALQLLVGLFAEDRRQRVGEPVATS